MYLINKEAGLVTVRFPAPPATSITRELRHKGWDETSPNTWQSNLLSQTVLQAIRAVTGFNNSNP